MLAPRARDAWTGEMRGQGVHRPADGEWAFLLAIPLLRHDGRGG